MHSQVDQQATSDMCPFWLLMVVVRKCGYAQMRILTQITY